MPYQVAQEQLNDLRKAFATKNGRPSTLHDADITELVNKHCHRTGNFELEFSLVVIAMLAKEVQHEDARKQA
jgi:hypothetical protein